MNTYVGIDIAKAELVAHALPQELRRSFANTSDGLTDLICWLQEIGSARVVFEATGGYERALLKALFAAGLVAERLSANRPRELARALGLKAKTDAIDARVLAVAAQLLPASPSTPLPEKTALLREWLQARSALVSERDAHRRRIKQLESAPVRAVLTGCIARLQKQIQQIEKTITKLLAEIPDGLAKAPGLGPILRATLAARLPELGAINRRQIAALAGLAPYNRDSGMWRGQRHIVGGRADVRRVLYMATWSAIRCDADIGNCYRRLVDAGKPKKVAAVACMRKYLTRLNAMKRDNAPWKPIPMAA